MKSLKGRKYLDALCVYFWATTPVLISILTFTTYVAMGHTLTAAKVTLIRSYYHNVHMLSLDFIHSASSFTLCVSKGWGGQWYHEQSPDIYECNYIVVANPSLIPYPSHIAPGLILTL